MPNKTKEEEIRIPRPLGFTMIANQYHQEQEQGKKQELKRRLQNYIIQMYANNGMMINGMQVSLPDLSSYLDIPLKELIARVNKQFSILGNIFDNSDAGRNTRVLFVQALNWAWQSRATSEAQLRILMASQGNEYKAFVSGEVNKAIANNINSIKPLVDLIKLVTDGNGMNPLAPNEQPQEGAQDKFITAHEATLMLNQRNVSVLTDGKLLEEAYQESIGTDTIPEVVARHQNLNSIGIRHDGTKDKANGPAKTESGHEDYRERSMGAEVLDGDDFKA